MNKVIIINLNGAAYQLDEGGYDLLKVYLEQAQARLEGNPDKLEIIKDLEQAIADKCLRYLGRGKTVVSAVEVEQILREIGPVDGGHATGAAGAAGDMPKHDVPPRRLYQIREGAMISGVCNGIAASLNIDPTIIRVIFVLLALFHGAGIFLYILLMLIVPYAKTSEQLAAAQGGNAGLPYRVQRMVEKVKGKFGKKAS